MANAVSAFYASYPVLLQSLPARDERLRNTLLFVTAVLSPWIKEEDVKIFFPTNEKQWDHIFYYADRWLVVPLLYKRLQQKDLQALCPEEFLQALNTYYVANIKRNKKHKVILLDAIKILNDSGIKPVLLKGAHALVELLPDHQARMISDIDLLILEGKELYALEALKEKGYIQESHGNIKNDPKNHHLDPLFHPSKEVYLELHRRPNYSEHYPYVLKYCFDSMYLKETKIDNLVFYTLYPWQLLLYNQIHHYHGFINHPIYQYLDMRQIAEQASILFSMNSESEHDFMVRASNLLKEKKIVVDMQIRLIESLFAKPILAQDIEHGFNKKSLYILKRLLESPLTTTELIFQYSKYFYFLICQMLKLSWIKKRILNIDWYLSRPTAFRLHINNLKLIRGHHKI